MMRMTIIIMTIYKKHIGKILRGPVPGFRYTMMTMPIMIM